MNQYEKRKMNTAPVIKSINKIQCLLDAGIPVCRALFHQAVNNADKIPETNFADDSAVASRNVNMWMTDLGLLCEQKGKYFLVPSSNVVYANFK